MHFLKNITSSSKIYNHPFGVKEYRYSNEFRQEEVDDIIDYLEQSYFANESINLDAPGFQTPGYYNLFSEGIFEKLLDTFLKSVRDYVNHPKVIDNLNLGQYDMYSWCYSNWKSSPREDLGEWHFHSSPQPDAISGIFYLKLPKSPGGETIFHIAGNEFELPSNEWSWFLFPSSYIHAPGKVFSTEKRYTISSDIYFEETIGKVRY